MLKSSDENDLDMVAHTSNPHTSLAKAEKCRVEGQTELVLKTFVFKTMENGQDGLHSEKEFLRVVP